MLSSLLLAAKLHSLYAPNITFQKSNFRIPPKLNDAFFTLYHNSLDSIDNFPEKNDRSSSSYINGETGYCSYFGSILTALGDERILSLNIISNSFVPSKEVHRRQFVSTASRKVFMKKTVSSNLSYRIPNGIHGEAIHHKRRIWLVMNSYGGNRWISEVDHDEKMVRRIT